METVFIRANGTPFFFLLVYIAFLYIFFPISGENVYEHIKKILYSGKSFTLIFLVLFIGPHTNKKRFLNIRMGDNRVVNFLRLYGHVDLFIFLFKFTVFYKFISVLLNFFL